MGCRMAIVCCSLPRSTIYTPSTLLRISSSLAGLVSWSMAVVMDEIAIGAADRSCSYRLALTIMGLRKVAAGLSLMINGPETSVTDMGSYPIRENVNAVV